MDGGDGQRGGRYVAFVLHRIYHEMPVTDLDSIASAIGYAWIQSEVHKTPAVPLIQVERSDLTLRAENLHALKLAGLSDSNEELLTLSEISEFAPFPAHKFNLVDHNRLAERYQVDNPRAAVTAIIDHHQDEGEHTEASPRIIAVCGSCASHVASLCPRELPEELATLLLAAIVIDTDGFKPEGKATQLDRDAGNHIAVKSTLARYLPPLSALAPIDFNIPDVLYGSQAIIELTQTLSDKKLDVSHLSAYDLLRRDYKEYTHRLPWASAAPSIKAGLSTVPLGLKDWADDGRLEDAAVKWMEQRGLTILGVLTTFHEAKSNILGKSSKGKHRREMAWIILAGPQLASAEVEGLSTDVLANRLWAGLEKESEIQAERSKKLGLEKGGKLPPQAKAMVYKQGNAHATRKAIAPLVKNILEAEY